MIKQFSEYKFGKLIVQVNYNKEVIPCKKVKIIIDDKFEEISSHDLYALLMLYADEEQMSDMVKVTEKKGRDDAKGGQGRCPKRHKER